VVVNQVLVNPRLTIIKDLGGERMEKSEDEKNVRIENEEISESENHKEETPKEKKKNTSIVNRYLDISLI
jgi:hypothetical protein